MKEVIYMANEDATRQHYQMATGKKAPTQQPAKAPTGPKPGK